MREINQAGLDLIKKWEGFKNASYQDIGGVWTVGYGHTGPDVHPGMNITEEQGEEILHIDLQTKAYPIDLGSFISDNQYAALCSLCFNVGINRVRRSQTYVLIKAGQSPDLEWVWFNTVNGNPSIGLTNRRRAELVLFHKVSL